MNKTLFTPIDKVMVFLKEILATFINQLLSYWKVVDISSKCKPICSQYFTLVYMWYVTLEYWYLLTWPDITSLRCEVTMNSNNGVRKFLWNVGTLLPDNKASPKCRILEEIIPFCKPKFNHHTYKRRFWNLHSVNSICQYLIQFFEDSG